ncbi:MAG: lipid A export permease/ATP-binding protein MsbA [Psittacicella sp.]
MDNHENNTEQNLNTDQKAITTIKALLPYVKPYIFLMIIAAIGLAVSAGSESYMIYLLKPLLNDGFTSEGSYFLKIMAFAVVGLIALRGLSSIVANYTLDWISQNIIMKIRREIFKHLMFLPTSFFDVNATGKLVSRITYDSEQVALASATTLLTILRNAFYIIALLGMMIYTSWRLSVVLFIIAPIVGILTAIVSKMFRKTNKKIQTSMGVLTNATTQMIEGHQVILAFGGQKAEEKRFNEVSNNMRRKVMKNFLIAAFSDPIIQIIASFALAVTLYLASYKSLFHGHLSAGTFAVVFSSMLALMRPVKSILSVNNSLQRGIAACQTLFKLMEIPPEEDNGKIENNNIKGNITFNNVSFKYKGSPKESLKNVSFNIQANKITALVGSSGSGKTTLTALISRIYNVTSGEIILDGVNIKDYKLQFLRSKCAVVSQQIHLFDGSLIDNIAYPNPTRFTEEEIIQACRNAYAWEFIEKLPNKLQSIIGEGGISLSGGQRQRIAIARAFLLNAPILILDEATSALDSESERYIQQAITDIRHKYNKTVIIIAHRLSTILNSDKIVVLEDGEILEKGTHNDLLSNNGTYTKLYNMQFNVNKDID